MGDEVTFETAYLPACLIMPYRITTFPKTLVLYRASSLSSDLGVNM